MWVEGVPPLLVVEFVSGNGDDTPGTGKYWIYEQEIQARYYTIWDPKREDLEVYERIGGKYERLSPNANGRYSIPPMELELGIWDGLFKDKPGVWLRGWDANAKLIANSAEDNEESQALLEAQRRMTTSERRKAETEKQRAETEKQRAEKLAAKLRELGVDPNQI